jgi:RHS repeat-associated protein
MNVYDGRMGQIFMQTFSPCGNSSLVVRRASGGGPLVPWDFHWTIPEPEGVTTSMVYDYDGNMVQKNVGGQVTRYVYAGGPAPVAEINVTANTEKDFIQANGRTWGVMEATQNTYFHHDAIGSVVALSNDSGQVTDTYEYEPFGKVLQHQGTSTNDYQFVGGYGVRKLNDTLDTMGVRQYSETVGRFTTQDPIGFKDAVNRYAYTQNNTLARIDPSGYKWFTLTLGYGISFGTGPVGVSYQIVTVHDKTCDDTTYYQMLAGGLAGGADLTVTLSPTSVDFEGGENQWAGSFEGVGFIQGSAALFKQSPTILKIPQGPSVTIPSQNTITIGFGTYAFTFTWVKVVGV